jgi:FkbM family methyltransferase
MKAKIALFLSKLNNRLFIQNHKGLLSHQKVFTYLLNSSIEGKYFGFAGNVNDGGEIAVIDIVNKVFSNESATIFDVGANKGQYQDMLLHYLKLTQFKIYSFEPSPFTFELLNAKTKSNVANFNIGLGNKNEELELFRTGPGSPLSSLYKKTKIDYYNVEMNQSEKVKIETLDNFCSKHAIDKIHFLKMDVEGHEISVLQGATNFISEHKIDMIQFEFGPPNIDSRTYLRDFFLTLNDYRIFRIIKDGILEINYSEKEEIFLPVNYLAVSNKIKL